MFFYVSVIKKLNSSSKLLKKLLLESIEFKQCQELLIILTIELLNLDLVFKTELIYKLDVKKISTIELQDAIADYIFYY